MQNLFESHKINKDKLGIKKLVVLLSYILLLDHNITFLRKNTKKM